MQKKPLTLQSSRLIIDRYAQKASENHITPHIFWHTFAASILNEGIDIRYIQSRLPPDANTSWIWLHFDHAEYIYITSKQGCLPKEAERKNRSNYKVKSVVEGRHFLPYGESTVDNQLLSIINEVYEMLDREIVFIADRVKNHDNATIYSYDLEKLADEYFEQMRSSLNSCASTVTYYSSPNAFLDHISEHKESLVFSLWSGESLKNRRALIPSICEAYGIPYVGADPYIHTICADKHLCKMLCKRCDISFANDVIISSAYDFPLLKKFKYPAVVKPNFEGGSIGIFNSNLVNNYNDATLACQTLLSNFSQLIVEEYIPGEEINVCIAGTGKHIDIFEAVRISIDGKSYFDHDLLGAEAKKMKRTSNTYTIVTDCFPATEREKLIKLYYSMDKVELIRVDGRLNKSTFTMIELTPDCSLSPSSSMFFAFQAAGYPSHESMIEKICQNSLIDLKSGYRNANKK